jgi:hypothetical protein
MHNISLEPLGAPLGQVSPNCPLVLLLLLPPKNTSCPLAPFASPLHSHHFITRYTHYLNFPTSPPSESPILFPCLSPGPCQPPFSHFLPIYGRFFMYIYIAFHIYMYIHVFYYRIYIFGPLFWGAAYYQGRRNGYLNRRKRPPKSVQIFMDTA